MKKKGFSAKGSSHTSGGSTFKGSVELKTRYLSIWIHLEVFLGSWNLFCGLCKNPIFLECMIIGNLEYN